MKHYYFKFKKENKGIEQWEKKNTPNIDLSIYYGNWRVEQYPNNIGNRNKTQIDAFFNLKNEQEPIYFWVFYKEYILCFEPTNLNVYNGPEEYINEKGSFPKSIEATRIEAFKKIEHPEFFSNINSNQKYNRKTITEIKGSEKEYADSLINKIPISININNYYKYLSPTEFETLIFLIFTNESSLCSSFRGGTLKDYDLRIFLEKEFHGIDKEEHWLQIKLKEYYKPNNKLLTIYLGKTNLEEKMIGIDWVSERIKERQDIKKWLNKCTFNYEFTHSQI